MQSGKELMNDILQAEAPAGGVTIHHSGDTCIYEGFETELRN